MAEEKKGRGESGAMVILRQLAKAQPELVRNALRNELMAKFDAGETSFVSLGQLQAELFPPPSVQAQNGVTVVGPVTVVTPQGQKVADPATMQPPGPHRLCRECNKAYVPINGDVAHVCDECAGKAATAGRAVSPAAFAARVAQDLPEREPGEDVEEEEVT